ncbi:proline-rich protein 4-like, partial [Phalaenopsis equestris]|uniref:proline-rich protein 4-like n=1 Tax=Phalaenopsis equestris TaxID=78828 RepID=UPI0009E557FB
MGSCRYWTRSLFLGYLVLFFFSLCLCIAAETSAVVGSVECVDCGPKSLRNDEIYKGLKVGIKCKTSDPNEYTTKATTNLNKDGTFHVHLPTHLLTTDHCFAQLHDSTNKPCSHDDSTEHSKLVYKDDGTYFIVDKLKFSSAACSSALFWPLPPLPTWHPIHKYLPWHKPSLYFPPWPPKPYLFPKKPLPPPIPIYMPPIYKPPIVLPPIIKPPPIVKPPIVKPPI